MFINVFIFTCLRYILHEKITIWESANNDRYFFTIMTYFRKEMCSIL